MDKLKEFKSAQDQTLLKIQSKVKEAEIVSSKDFLKKNLESFFKNLALEQRGSSIFDSYK